MKNCRKSTKNMMDILSEEDESFMEEYLYGKEIKVERIYHAIRQATIKNRIVPVLCGSALKNKGIQLLLDAVNRYLPSPLEVLPVKGEKPDSGKR